MANPLMARFRRPKARIRPGTPEPPQSADPYDEFSDRDLSIAIVLREARQEVGYALSDVAPALRIRLVYLQAIEEGRYEDLPGLPYAVGFVRTYAEFLGLDPAELVRRFKDEMAGAEGRQELVFPEPVAEGRVPVGAVLLIAVIVTAVAYAGWYYLSSTDQQLADLLPDIPTDIFDFRSDETGADSETVTGPEIVAGPETEPVPLIEGESPPAEDARLAVAVIDDPVQPIVSAPQPAPQSAADVTVEPVVTPDQQHSFFPLPPASDEADGEVVVGAAAGALDPVTEEGLAGLPPSFDAAEPAAEDPVAGVETAEDETLVDRAVAVERGGPDVPSAFRRVPLPSRRPADLGSVVRTPPAPADPQEETAETPDEAAVDAGRAAVAAALPAGVVPPRPEARPRLTDPDGRVIVRASSRSWVEIRDPQGAPVRTQVMRAGDEYIVPREIGLTLATGNAGGITIIVDGHPMAPLGGDGEIVLDVSLDPRDLAALPN